MAQKRPFKKIVVALWLGNASGREILSGIYRYAREAKFWQITLLILPNGFSTSIVDQILTEGADGIITSDPENDTIRMLADRLSIPLVIIGFHVDIPRAKGGIVSYVDRDDFGIGSLGARYLLSAGRFNSFGFVQEIDSSHKPPNERERGFVQTLSDSGRSCSSLSTFTAPSGISDANRLALWLESLPKPTAVMCFYDPPAVQVLNVCREIGLDVPTQVSVLGVDNDETICETSSPPLSSLQPDHENMGYRAGRQLQAHLLNRKRFGHKTALLHKIVERDTTKPIAPSANLVRRALFYIRENASKGIDVQAVANALGVSRRLVDLRFREIEHRTIHEAIEQRKLDIAVQKLTRTSQSIERIASTCGYSSPQVFRTAFKKHYKVSPRRYRETARDAKSPPSRPASDFAPEITAQSASAQAEERP